MRVAQFTSASSPHILSLFLKHGSSVLRIDAQIKTIPSLFFSSDTTKMAGVQKFHISNLSQKSTKESLTKFLGLDATPYLRSSSWVDLPLDQSGKCLGFAYISVPTHLGTHLGDFNNTKFLDKRIFIQPVYGKGSQPPMYSSPNAFMPFDVGSYGCGIWPRPGNIRNRRYGGQPISYEQVSIPVEKKLALIDVAINLTNKIFSLDLDFVLDRAINSGIEKMILTGNTIQMSDKSVILANRHPGLIYAGVGIHPHFAEKQWSAKTLEVIKRLVSLPEVVAVGEVGLDFHRNYSKQESQIEAFEKQVELACEHQKPVLAHERAAHQKFLEVLSKFRGRLPPVVVHCFTGTKAEMKTYTSMGFYIGITGFICKEKVGKDLREAIKDCPLDRILLESDAPYMIPNAPITELDSVCRSLIAKCKTGRNEPCTLPVVAYTVAKCLEIDVEEVAKATMDNANRVFNLTNTSAAKEET